MIQKRQRRLCVIPQYEKYLLVDHMGSIWLNGQPTWMGAYGGFREIEQHLSETPEDALKHLPVDSEYVILPSDTPIVRLSIDMHQESRTQQYYCLTHEAENVNARIRGNVPFIEIVHTDGTDFVNLTDIKRTSMAVI